MFKVLTKVLHVLKNFAFDQNIAIIIYWLEDLEDFRGRSAKSDSWSV